MRRLRRAVLAIVLTVAVSVPVSLASGAPASADENSFDPGYIISDENFFDGDAMSEAEIQAFLNAKSQGCSAGYICLSQYSTQTGSRSADPMCASYSGGGVESAARIISKVAMACGISPKVLLVTLQKEQSLVTYTSPTAARYDRAMGFACPDTAGCDTLYYGFFNQVYSAARQLKRYGNPPGTSDYFTWYPVGAVSQVRYSPNASCGSSAVKIQNKATAALYYYTPYQPNAAALANLYGTGDGCSSYGNRNFWRQYRDWFGSPVASRYASFDAAIGQYGGVRVSGWSVDPSTAASSYIWVNIDGQGAPYTANVSLAWFNAYLPGYGSNHGFDALVPAAPGSHEVCVYNTATNSSLISCKWVDVPRGQGNVDSVVPTVGSATVSGWSVDFATTEPSYVWINVDGQGTAYLADVQTAWIDAYFPGSGQRHGFSARVPTSPGAHEICVYGIFGPESVLLSCTKTVSPRAAGALDSAQGDLGGIRVTGWSADAASPQRSFVWVNVDSSGALYATNTTVSWLPGYLPGIGAGNGFDYTLPARKGAHRVCAYNAQTAQLFGCRTATVPLSAAGSLDSVTVVPGGIRVTGWSIDLTSKQSPSYIWVNMNGTGGPFVANAAVSWFDALYPGSGVNHGFDVTIPKPPGRYEVCVYGTEDLLRCQTVDVK